jgi:hypothetical protein
MWADCERPLQLQRRAHFDGKHLAKRITCDSQRNSAVDAVCTQVTNINTRAAPERFACWGIVCAPVFFCVAEANLRARAEFCSKFESENVFLLCNMEREWLFASLKGDFCWSTLSLNENRNFVAGMGLFAFWTFVKISCMENSMQEYFRFQSFYSYFNCDRNSLSIKKNRHF